LTLQVGAGVTFAAGLGVAIAKEIAAREQDTIRKSKETEAKAVREQLGELTTARKTLADLCDKDIAILSSGVGILGQVWTSAVADASMILASLQTGVDGVVSKDAPKVIQLALDEADKTYLVMAEYLEEYALGLEGIV